MQKSKKSVSTIVIVLVCVAIVGLVIASIFMFSGKSDNEIMVSFETNGGSTVDSVEIAKGSILPEIEAPYKDGYLFNNWCYDENLLSVYNNGDIVSKNTMLYARYSINTAVQFFSEFLEDCSTDITFKLASEEELNKNNLMEYIIFSDTNSTGTTLQVKKEDGYYILFSETGFPEGCEFGITLNPQNNISFKEANGVDVSKNGMSAYHFAIKKENIFDVSLYPDILFVDNDQTLAIEYDAGTVTEGTEYDVGKSITALYFSSSVNSLEKGTIINLSTDPLTIGNYYKVLSSEYPVSYAGNASTMKVRVITPELYEVYSKYELYQKGGIEAVAFEEQAADISMRVVDSVMTSEGFAMYLDSVMYGIKNSPSVQSIVRNLSVTEKVEFSQLSASFIFNMIKDPPVTFSVVSDSKGLVLDITIDTGSNISFKVGSAKIDLRIIVEEHVTVTPEGHTLVVSDKYTYSNKGAYVNSTSKITFKANIKYTGPSDPKEENTTTIGVDIGKEIEKACADKSLEEYLKAMGYGNLFAEDLDYVKIASVPLGFMTFTFSGVESIRIELNLNISVGCSAGISTELISTSIRHMGITNGHTNFLYDSDGYLIKPLTITPLDKPERYNVLVASKFSYDITLKGQIGIRVGVEVNMTFSILGLNQVVGVGIYAEVGAYAELTGYVRFQGSIYKNDELTRKESSVKGGIYFETGVYLSCGFTWDCFGYKGNWPFLDMKFPLYSIGTDNLPVDFVNTNETILIDAKKYDLAQSTAANPSSLALSWVNIIGVNSSISDDKNLDHYDIFMTKIVYEHKEDGSFVQTNQPTKNNDYVSISNGRIVIADNSPKRFDFTVYVMYNKGTRLFDGESIVKQINFTYVDASIENPNAQHQVTFYDNNSNVIEQTSYYEGQIPVQPDLFEWNRASSEYTVIYDSDKGPWLDAVNGNVKPISPLGNKDESYYLSYKKETFNISFYGYVYNESTDQYSWGLIDSVPTEVGKIPAAPDVPMTDVYKFYRWDMELLAPTADSYRSLYNAVYMDRYTKHMIDFECAGELISRQWVKEGDTPLIPEMSGWVSKDGKWGFSRWYSSKIVPATYSHTYKAVIVGVNSTVFNPGVWTIAAGAPAIYTGEYTYDGEKYFIVPDIKYDKPAGATRETLYWQSTEKLDGDYIKIYPGDRSIYYNLEFEPIFEYTVHLLITGDNKQILKGKAGDVLTEDMITLSKNQDGSEFVDWGIDLPYTFGSTLDSYGFPDLEVVFNVNLNPVEADFTVTFISNGGQFSDGSETNKIIGKNGQDIVFEQIPVKPRSDNVGYEFIGWGTNADAAVVLESLGKYGADFTCYAVYREVYYYTVTYDAGQGVFVDGTSKKEFELASGSSLPSMTEKPSKLADSYYSYVFKGWISDSQGSEVIADALLTADYTATDIVYKAVFNAGGGYFSDGSTSKTVTGKYLESIIIEEPVKSGQIFSGWGISILQFTGNKTYTAQYQMLSQFKITFDASLAFVYDEASEQVLQVDPLLSSIYFSDEQVVKSYIGTFNEIMNLSTNIFATGYSLIVYKNGEWVTINGTTDGSSMYFMADIGTNDLLTRLSIYDWSNDIVTDSIHIYPGETSSAVLYVPGTIRFGLATYWFIENGEILESPGGYEITFAPYIVIH